MNVQFAIKATELFLIEVNPRYWQTLLGSAAMGVNFPDLHCRLAFGERPTAPMYRTGSYLDSHSLLTSPRNILALLRRDPGFLRYARWRIMLADPRVEITIAYDTAKRQLVKAISHAGRLVRRIVAGRGRSSQPR